jgi:hypothetical protein
VSNLPPDPEGIIADLLAALHYLLEQTVDADMKYGIELTEGETEAREMALAAIAKATGEETNA